MTFNIGQKVYIKNRLCEYLDSVGINHEMISMCGKLVTITNIRKSEVYNPSGYLYSIKEDNGRFLWEDRWFTETKQDFIKKISYPINWEEIISKGYGKI